MFSVGIVGSHERAQIWEQHLRTHKSVEQVVITSSIHDLGPANACLILDNSDQRMEQVFQAIRLGLHVFLIAPLPTDKRAAERVYRASEEANVIVQFSHWPTLTPSTQWMQSKLSNPTSMQIIREIPRLQYTELQLNLEQLWIDEVAFCSKWMGGVHHIEGRSWNLADNEAGFQLFMRFDNTATAMIYINTTAEADTHRRVLVGKQRIADCNVADQVVRIGQPGDLNKLHFERRQFDPRESANLAATQFLKSIQLKRPSPYSAYDLMRATQLIEQIKQRIQRQ
jgi:predicted dehydrogenase